VGGGGGGGVRGYELRTEGNGGRRAKAGRGGGEEVQGSA
jgi:hypothetical protein